MTKLGLISDTHGRLDSRVFEIFRGVEGILHAGDVGDPEILLELSGLAPVTAVLGNTDDYPLTEQLKEVEFLTISGNRILMLHDIGRPGHPSEEVLHLVGKHQPAMVMFGHTHAPYDALVGGVRYVNPGGAGPPRFDLPRTVAVLDLTSGKAEIQFVDLETGEPLCRGGMPS